MIAIVSSNVNERMALAAICSSRGWKSMQCESVRSFSHAVLRAMPKILVVRQKLVDGFSDDLMRTSAAQGKLPACKIIVLLGAGAESAIEVRQLALGADSVLRDPIRSDVLTAYLAKYNDIRFSPTPSAGADPRTVAFAGGNFRPDERALYLERQIIYLTPREVSLVQLLAHSPGEVLTYDVLYSEVLGRSFQGDTSNMRVLLGKLSSSLQAAGVSLRRWVEVIPKTGYRYRAVE